MTQHKQRKKSVVVLGGTGFLGTPTMALLKKRGLEPVSLTRTAGVDIRDTTKLSRVLREIRPDVILNCAGHVGNLNYVTKQAADVIKHQQNIQQFLQLNTNKIQPNQFIDTITKPKLQNLNQPPTKFITT
jgi:nucleoside-diphosphate-sugar epimerase